MVKYSLPYNLSFFVWQLTWLADVCLANLLRTSSENSDSLFSPKTIPICELTSPALNEASTVQVF